MLIIFLISIFLLTFATCLEALVMQKTKMTNLSGILVVGIMVTLVDTLSYQKALSKDS